MGNVQSNTIIVRLKVMYDLFIALLMTSCLFIHWLFQTDQKNGPKTNHLQVITFSFGKINSKRRHYVSFPASMKVKFHRKCKFYFKDCPPIHEAMDSGQISLGTIETSGLDPNVNYMFDCVWLVTCRYHTYGSDGKELPPKMFVSVLEANLVEGEPTTRLFS